MRIPETRGPVSSALFKVLVQAPASSAADLDALHAMVAGQLALAADIIGHEDIQLSLFSLYELHYSGLDGVADDWEWEPGLIRIRRMIEEPFEKALREAARKVGREHGVPATGAFTGSQLPGGNPTSDDVARILFDLAASDTGPSVSRYVARKASLEQLKEFLVHKSVYQLKEADPHTWAIPRLTGRAKAALVEIQADEYGGGRPERMHSALFARTMRGIGLDDSYGAYVDSVPAVSLASVNLMSLCGLNRRLRGAITGHLAIYEMTSSQPNRFYGNGFRRHGFDAGVTHYFDEHVEADAVHEQIAGRDLAGGLVEAEPELLGDVLFGATAVMAIDSRLSAHLLGSWESGKSSLRAAVPVAA
ncbi:MULTISPECIES: iron-containing redox enzyme family protein [unclassified Arthrobacter]|uniref:iron-containing redox enzyme family protein n=1 Tax=unclassified Arthrobacter TaxID=235627 RepID=UPI001C846302|nr:iron-containing redox enzyme family protein [Arthrobacter sp. MAHUQ-56]MBX7446092.1 iron-containing redox enzyme family protein [Arthrobacter sp. MAHUQ-56]